MATNWFEIMAIDPKKIARGILIMVVLWLTACIMFSCSAERQLARLIKKHPELVKDTSIVDYDTTVFHLPAVYADSVVTIRSFMTDTIYLKQDRLTVKTYVYNDSVYIEGECAEIIDTVFSVEQIKVPYVVYQESQLSQWVLWIAIAAAGFLIAGVRSLRK